MGGDEEKKKGNETKRIKEAKQPVSETLTD